MATHPNTIERPVSQKTKSKRKESLPLDETLKRLDTELPAVKLSPREKIVLGQTLFRLHK